MKRSLVMVLAALILPASLAAQNTPADRSIGTVFMTNSTGHKTVFVTVAGQPACPVSMQAKQGSGAGLVAVRRQPGQPDDRPSFLSSKAGQHIHLILGRVPGSQLDFEQIARGTVSARGLSARSHATPAAIGGDSSDIHRTLDVTFSRESDGAVYADIDLPGFTSVQFVRIDSIVLKDGSKWNFDTRQGCTVTPDPLMLIANQ